MRNNLEPMFISIEEAITKFNLEKHVHVEEDILDRDISNVILFDTDLIIEGNLDIDWTKKTLIELGIQESSFGILILINGNVKVNGDINFNDMFPCLFVLGNVECEALYGSDEFIYINGDANIKYLLSGRGAGIVSVKGNTNVPYVINSNHTTKIKPKESLVLNNGNSDKSDNYLHYKYTYEDFETVFVEEVLSFDGGINIIKFIEHLKLNKSVFIKS